MGTVTTTLAVAGATGTLGRSVAEAARRDGHEVRETGDHYEIMDVPSQSVDTRAVAEPLPGPEALLAGPTCDQWLAEVEASRGRADRPT